MAVAILTQFTPNPNAMKFILNRDVKSTGKVTFRSADEANGIALVEALFALVVVEQVHLFENVVTVTKIDQAPWEDMADWVKQVLTNHVEEHDPDFELADATGGGPVSHVRDDQPPEVRQIEEVLDRTVRPYLQGDGGDLDVVAYDNNRVVVSYVGACGTCPSSAAGTLQAVQSVLRDEVNPEIEVVSAETG
jgi:Fe-S cluster biogenesis protein NfuA